MSESLLETLKYILPSIVVFLTAYLLMRSFFKNEKTKLDYQVKANNKKELLPLRLQAYERLTVFMERITPVNIVPRVMKNNATAINFQRQLVQQIRMEYEHNISQQIYVSDEVWHTVELVKDLLIKDIYQLTAGMPEGASAKDLSKRLLQYYMESDETIPTQRALLLINAEVKKLY